MIKYCLVVRVLESNMQSDVIELVSYDSQRPKLAELEIKKLTELQ